MSLGANIKKRRYELNLSQQELADLMGYKTRSTIAKIESGENDVTQSKLMRFAEVLDTTVEELITGNKPFVYTENTPVSISADAQRNNKNAVIILAGGRSVRNQQSIPNQFINVLGKPILVYCLEAYQNHPLIDDIYVVCLKGWESIVSSYAKQYNITKMRMIILSGSSGVMSVKNGITAISDRYSADDCVIIQESTRPMVNADIISKTLLSCSEKGTATVCRKMKEHIQFTVKNGKTTYLDRDSVVDIQSPEAYRFSKILELFAAAFKADHPLQESCCTMLMYELGFDINFVESSNDNIKIVRQEDIAVFTSYAKNMY